MGTQVNLMGCPLDPLTMAEAVERMARAMATRIPLRHTALNVAKLVAMQQDAELRRDVATSDMVTADGAGIVLAARLMGMAVPERVAGIDLMAALIELAAARGHRPYLLGARPEVVDTAAYRLMQAHPALRLAGWRDGYFCAEQEADVVAEINRSGADCLFVALPTPMKERFLARNAGRLDPPVIMGIGGALDVIAGRLPRAPLWMQRAGLEWLFRLIREPRRMWRRYLVTNTIFALWLAKALGCRALGRPFAPVRFVR